MIQARTVGLCPVNEVLSLEFIEYNNELDSWNYLKIFFALRTSIPFSLTGVEVEK